METPTIHAPNEKHLVLIKEELEIIKASLSFLGINAKIGPDTRLLVESIIAKL